MKCSDVMKRVVETVRREDTIGEAARKMRDEGVGFLPVVDGSGRPIGVVTDRDIVVRSVADDGSPWAPVGHVMTEGVIAVSIDDDVLEVREHMRDHQVARIVCTGHDGALAGVISLSDLPGATSEQEAAETFSAVVDREART